MAMIPGLMPALVLAIAGRYQSRFIGVTLMGLQTSEIMVAILLAIRISLGQGGGVSATPINVPH